MKLLELWDGLKNRREFFNHDDFMWYISPHLWTNLTSGAGSPVAPAVVSGAGGILSQATGTTADDESAFATTNKPFLFAFEKPLLYETRIQIAEANTNQAQPVIGFSSVLNTTGMMQASSAGPAASFSGAILYKTAGGTTWNFRVSIGSTNQDIALREPVGDTAYHTYRIEVREGSQGAGLLEAVPFRDGLQMMPLGGSPFGPPVKIAFSPTSAAAMQCGNYLRGASSTSETLLTDYCTFGQLR